MLVPAVLNASTSPSPANVPPVSATVALTTIVEFGSVTASDGASGTATVWFSVKATCAGGFTAGVFCTVIVSICAALVRLPSLVTQLSVRVGLELALLGSPPDAKVIESSTAL